MFSDAEKATAYAFKELAEFTLGNELIITKGYLDSPDEICAVYPGWNDISDIYSFSFDPVDVCDNSRFENAFVHLPHPFRMGDYVRTMGLEEIGIFRGCKNEEDYQKTQGFLKGLAEKGISDFTDVCCTADYLIPCSDNINPFCFSHNHPSLITLEFADIKEGNPQYELMKQAQQLVRGEGSLELFTEAIVRSENHCHKVCVNDSGLINTGNTSVK